MKKLNWFKRTLLILLSASTLLVFASCDAQSNHDDNYFGNHQVEGKPSATQKPSALPEAAVPGENVDPSDKNESGIVENPFIPTQEQAISTFSADVDTASYAYFRKLVNAGYSFEALKEHYAAAFRTEEFINYFQYSTISPAGPDLFGVQHEIVPCPWNDSTALLRVSLRAKDAPKTSGNNLVFLIDVSGSMASQDKLPLLQEAFSALTVSLTARDTVSIVTYSGSEKVVLRNCPGNETDRILHAINSLRAYGSTNGEAGMRKAYDIAKECYIEGGNNRIIMASDGDLNVGISSEQALISFIETKRNEGIFLSVLGFGTGNYRDSKMEALADNGNGVYYYIDSMGEAEKIFGTDLLSTLYTVGKDVKLQIEFDPKYVTSYRLIGYENRLLDEEDFEDDTKDAGDVGAGHRVTVCYELTLSHTAMNSENDPWMNLSIRYKAPDENISSAVVHEIGAQSYHTVSGDDTKFISCVIQTVMLLHDSKYSGGYTLEGILETLDGMNLEGYPDRVEFCELIRALVQRQK